MVKKYMFEFAASVEAEVEFPDGIEEGSDEYENILHRACNNICVDDHAEWLDAYPLDE